MKAEPGPRASDQIVKISQGEIAQRLEQATAEIPALEEELAELKKFRKKLLKQKRCAEKGHPFKFKDKGDGGGMGGRFEEVCSGCGWTNWC